MKGGEDMIKTTLKCIKGRVTEGYAKNITNISAKDAGELLKNGIDGIAYSTGIYGINGLLIQDKNGNQYAVCGRSTTLFILAQKVKTEYN